MAEITKDILQLRMTELQGALDKAIANVNIIIGHKAEIENLLAYLDRAETEGSE